jgi:hypothetical protein
MVVSSPCPLQRIRENAVGSATCRLADVFLVIHQLAVPQFKRMNARFQSRLSSYDIRGGRSATGTDLLISHFLRIPPPDFIPPLPHANLFPPPPRGA